MVVESLSGIRGVYGSDLTPTLILRYGASFFSFLKNPKRIVIGMDSRSSGPAIKDALLSQFNCEVIDVGILPTPAIQNAVRHFEADGGIIITASHNPLQHNGLKLLRRSGEVLTEGEMEKVISLSKKIVPIKKSFLEKLPFIAEISSSQKPLERKEEAIKAYSDQLFSILGRDGISLLNHEVKVALDFNGGSAVSVQSLFSRFGMKIVPLNSEIGVFAHEIEPSSKSLSTLSSSIKKEKCDFGAGFDCDADRAEIVLLDGSVISGNELIALAARWHLSNSEDPSKESVVVNNATSGLVREVVEGFGAKLVEVEVGESNVVSAMKELGSVVGGEGSSSGVVVFPSTSRDGILGVLLLGALIATEKKSAKELLDSLPHYFYLKEKVSGIDFSSRKKEIIAHYQKKKKTIISKEPSLKIAISKKGFIWFRESKTEQGVLRVICDSPSKKEAESSMKEALSLLASKKEPKKTKPKKKKK